ncbi:MAG: TonB-dependent receptor [Ignavibacteriales bacterium]|nr:TonB-dependent receptor [Ignavibacteriales bacterium]
MDTTIYRFPEVIVTATRSQIPLQDSPSPVEVINVTNSPALQGSTVADVLKTANGVFLQDLGGNGALKTVFLRGTAPQHLLVLLNGIRFNSLQNGLVDMSLLPLNDIDRIEIVRGGSSALYGADALGGVVNILTRQPRPGTRLRAEGGGGSYGYRRWLLEAEGGYESVGLLAGVAGEEGNDNYQFVHTASDQSEVILRRKNSDFAKLQAYLHSDLPLGSQSDLVVSSQLVRVKRGVPGSLSFPSDLARQDDENANVHVGYRNAALNLVEFQLHSAFHYDFQTYLDPNPGFPIDVTYRNTFVMVNPQIQVVLDPSWRTHLGAEVGSGRLNGNDFDGTITRLHRAAYVSQEASWTFQREWLDKLSLYGMVRYDDISDVGTALMPKVGVNVRVVREPDVRVRGSYGSSFRAPSFNDLYYVGFNNPDLKAERSTGFDGGLISTVVAGGIHSLELTYFDINTKDRILFDLLTFKPVNIGKTRSTGMEAKYTGAFWEGDLNLGLSYTLTDARKQHRSSDSDPTFGKRLQFIPGNTVHAHVIVSIHPFTCSLVQSFVGRRYINEDNSGSLPMHALTGLGFGSRIAFPNFSLSLKAEIQNLFDRKYQIFPDYPMPGRTFRLRGGIEY